MELRKKSILIALCIGDGYITHQKQVKKGKTYQYNYLEISHGQHQKDYIEWKANLCKSITGRKCNVREKNIKLKVFVVILKQLLLQVILLLVLHPILGC